MFGQGDMVGIAMGLHELPPERRDATEARIKNFLKLGFPAITRVGTGDRTEYSAADAVQLVIGFELLRFRMPPSAIAAVVTGEWAKIANSFRKAARELRLRRQGLVPNESRPLLSIDSRALHETGKTIEPDQMKSTVRVRDADDMAGELGSGATGFRSGLIIDPVFVLEGLVEQLPRLRRRIEADALLDEIAGWTPRTPAEDELD